MNFPDNYHPSSFYSEEFTEDAFKNIKKDETELLSFFKSALEDNHFWEQLQPNLKGKIVKAIKKQVSNSDLLSLTFVNSIQSISEKTFNNLFDAHGQITHWLQGNIGNAEFLTNDLSTLAFYTKLMKNAERLDNPPFVILILLNSKAIFKEKIDMILSKDITEKNIFNLFKIALNTNNRSLKNECLNFLKDEMNLESNHISINHEKKIIVKLNLPLAERVNLDKLKIYIKHSAPIEIQARTSVKYFNEQRGFFEDFSSNITSLQLHSDESKHLSAEIGNLKNLQNLHLRACPLETLPETIGHLSKLQILNLGDCIYLQTLPETIGNLKNLMRLSLRECRGLQALPETISHLEHLETLNLNNCSKLQSFPAWISRLKNIFSLSFKGCNFSDFDKLHLVTSFEEKEAYSRVFKNLFPNIAKIENSMENLFFFKPSFQVKEDFNIQVFFKSLHLAKMLPENLQKALLNFLKDSKVDLNFLKNFVSQNRNIIAEHIAEEGLIILRIINDLSQKNLDYKLLDIYLSRQEDFFPPEDLKEYLITNEGMDLLIKHKENIFNKLPQIRTFVENTFPASEEANSPFYPIQIEFSSLINGSLIKIKCYKKDLFEPENCRFILEQISKALVNGPTISGFHVSYRNEAGIDSDGLTKDLITTIFETISKHERFFESIPKEEKNFQFLGPFLKYIFNSRGRFLTGEVFHDSFFKGMFHFTAQQRNRALNSLMPDQEMINLLTAYNTEQENERIKNIFAFLNWNGLPEENFNSAIHLVKFYHEALLSMDSQLEDLVQRVGYNRVIEYQNFRSKSQATQGWISWIKSLFTYPKQQTRESLNLFEELKDQLEAIQNWIHENRNPQLKLLKKSVSEEVLIDYKNQLKNLGSLLQSMHFTDNEWNVIQSQGLEFFKTSIQGEFNRDKLLKKIEYQTFSREGFPENIKVFFEKWIRETDEDQLKIFLKQVTGFTVVPVNDPIKLFAGKRFFQVHACFNLIDIPNDLSEEQFLEYMATLLADKEGAFHIA